MEELTQSSRLQPKIALEYAVYTARRHAGCDTRDALPQASNERNRDKIYHVVVMNDYTTLSVFLDPRPPSL